MQTHRTSGLKRGFTLMELMVAMAITSIIVTVLVSITSIALDTWNRSRSELRASRQAKSFIDTMARDFESLVVRRGNKNEWLSAVAGTSTTGGKVKSPNASEFVFFTAVTDRYNGDIGGTSDKGGDVSCVAYKLDYRDPINAAGTKFETFVMNRALVNPDDTFKNLLGVTEAKNPAKSLKTVFSDSAYAAGLAQPSSFICENIFQFTVTFNVQISRVSGTTTTLINVPVTIGKGKLAEKFYVSGTGIENDYSGNVASQLELESGRITSVNIAVTVLSDSGVDGLTKRTLSGEPLTKFLSQNTYEYTKTVQIPSM